MTRELRLALCQAAAGRTVDECTAIACDAIAKAGREGCHVIQFAELFFPGYGVDRQAMCAAALDRAQPQEQPWFVAVSAACAESQIYAVVGYVERNNADLDKPFNSVCIVAPTGTVVLNHRKAHLWSSYEGDLFTPGDRLGPLVDIAGVKVGLAICFEVEFPEVMRTLALEGAELVFVPTALVNPFNARTTVPSRAMENNFFVAYCNDEAAAPSADGPARAGPKAIPFAGLSCVCDPAGADLLRFTTSEALNELKYAVRTCVVRPDDEAYIESKRRNPYLTSRRPKLYSPALVASS